MTPKITPEELAALTVNDLLSAYSGVARKCCCGCSGKYSYVKANQEAASEFRGYEVRDEEINDRTAKTILRKVQRAAVENPRSVEFDSNNACFTDYSRSETGRWYIIYPKGA